MLPTEHVENALIPDQINVLRSMGYMVIPPSRPRLLYASEHTARRIIAAAARLYDTTPEALRRRSNAPEIVTPRSLAMWTIKYCLGYSNPRIGKHFGGKHHTTVLHAITKISRLRETDPEIRAALELIEEEAGRV